MNVLHRYLFKNLLIALVYITAALVFTIWLTQSLKLVQLVVSGGASAGTFFKLLFLSLPNFLSLILPVSSLIAILFTYNKMINDRELVIMRAVGLSSHSLALPALILSAVMTILCYFLTLYIAPTAYHALKNSQSELKESYASLLLKEGSFNTVRKNLTIYIEEKNSKGELRNIFIHDTRNPQKKISLFARKGVLVNENNTSKVLIFDGSREEFNPETGQTALLNFKKYLFNLDSLNMNSGQRTSFDPREVSTLDLWSYFQKDSKDLSSLKHRAEFHQRLTMPLYILGLSTLCLFFMLSGEFDRKGQTKKILIAVFAALALEILGIGLINLTTKHPQLVLISYIVPLVPVFFYFLKGRKRMDA